MYMKRIRQLVITVLLPMLFILIAACGRGRDDTVTSDTPPPDLPVEPTIDIAVGEVRVDRIQLNMMESFPIQMSVIVQGVLPDACSEPFAMPQTQEGNTLKLAIVAVSDPDIACAQVLTPFIETFNLDVLDLPAATYTVDINGVMADFTFTMDNTFQEDPASACPGGTENKISLINEESGYCLLYPVGFNSEEDIPGTVIISGPAYDDSPDPLRATLTIQHDLRSEGRSAKSIADAFLQEFVGQEGVDIVRSVIVLGGESAEVADGVPGRGLHRMAFVAHAGREYTLALAPFDEAFAIVRGDLELLWQTVVGSWRFLP
jgi:inhibitor of cysteine peptidase